MARYSWAATSSDTVDGSDRSAKKSLRFSTHSVSWKGSTGVVPFQAFLQLSTVRLYSFFAPKECGMIGLREANVNRVRRVAPEPVPKRCLLATRAPSRRGAYRRVGLAVGSPSLGLEDGLQSASSSGSPVRSARASAWRARTSFAISDTVCSLSIYGFPFPLGLFLPPPLRVFYPYRC
jgi:hypothetical protein